MERDIEEEIWREVELTLGLASATISLRDVVHDGRNMRSTAPPCLLFWGSQFASSILIWGTALCLNTN